MCIMSTVHDQFGLRIPFDWQPAPAVPFVDGGISITGQFVESPDVLALRAEVLALRTIVADFREAVEHARRLDVLMKQPDCVDPDKAKLEARVTELERRLDAVTKAFQGAL